MLERQKGTIEEQMGRIRVLEAQIKMQGVRITHLRELIFRNCDADNAFSMTDKVEIGCICEEMPGGEA